MGRHIWYGLAFGEGATFDEAIEKVSELHRYAQTVGFLGAHDLPGVSEIKMGDGTEKWPPTYTIERRLGNHREQHIHVPAMLWVGFSTMPGLGTESATFGLARYPKRFRPTGKESQIVTYTTHRNDGTVESDPSPMPEDGRRGTGGARPSTPTDTVSIIFCTAISRSSNCSTTRKK